jgi:hypothetical protein
LALASSVWTGLKPQDVDSSDENEKQASLPKLNSHAQNDLVLAILLRYVSFSQDSARRANANLSF